MIFYKMMHARIFVFIVPFLQSSGQFVNKSTQEIPTTISPTTIQTTPLIIGPFGVEILAIYVPSEIGNVIRLTWGGGREQDRANLTYGVYFGLDQGELEYPKLTTHNLSAVIEHLEYCTKYNFAVTVLGSNMEGRQVDRNTIRTVITGTDQLAAPANLTVDLQAREQPCLNLRWSAACANIVTPIGYVVSIFDKRISKYKVITYPKSKGSDLVYRMPVEYNDSYEIRVSTTFPGSKVAGPISYQVPEPLQPFKVRVVVNQEEEAFLIYWAEPFVPLSVGRYYYQVFVYPGQDLEAPYEKYYVTRPVMVYKGERGEYSFSVNLASNDRKHVSKVTVPVYANLNGESYELNSTLTETPDR